MENAQSKLWLQLYKQALSESDPQRLDLRILDAHRAIQQRRRQLWYEGSGGSSERSRLDAASLSLEIFRKVQQKEFKREQRGRQTFFAVA